jgi:hypothetical protein
MSGRTERNGTVEAMSKRSHTGFTLVTSNEQAVTCWVHLLTVNEQAVTEHQRFKSNQRYYEIREFHQVCTRSSGGGKPRRR